MKRKRKQKPKRKAKKRKARYVHGVNQKTGATCKGSQEDAL